jgi:EmrB/QacA subfamily drug resistance transporter
MHELELSKGNVILVMTSLMISLLLAALDSTIVGTAMPKIIGDLRGMEHYSWPFTSYMLCSTVAILIFGKLSDMYGRKPIFIGGIVVFLAASALCGAAQSMTQLILFRGFQGIGGGVVISNVFIIVAELFPAVKRGKYMGFLSSMWGLASVIGPAIGGFITDTLNWHWVFYVNIPLGILALVLVAIGLPHVRYTNGKQSIDIKGIAAFVALIVPLFLALTEGGDAYPWLSYQILGLLAFSVIMLFVLIPIERRAAEPIFPPALFHNSLFNVSVIVAFFSNAVMFCGVIYVPLFVQVIMGKSATSSGGITTPMMLGVAMSALTGGQIISRTGKYKALGVVSLALLLAGTVLLATMGSNASSWQVLCYALLLGVGSGGAIPVFNLAVQNVFPNRQLGIVTSSMQFFRNMGATVGAALFGYVLKSDMASGFASLNLTNVPARIVDALKNPRVLTDEAAMTAIRSHMPADFAPLFDNLVMKAKAALAHSIEMVFIVAVVATLVALLTSMALKEVPLRKHRDDGPKEGTSLSDR